MNFVKRIEKIKELNDKLDSDNFVQKYKFCKETIFKLPNPIYFFEKHKNKKSNNTRRWKMNRRKLKEVYKI